MRHGPTHDHTLMKGDGWSAYAVMEKQGSKTPVAQLMSTATGPFCFTAWYHQSGTRDSQAMFYAAAAEGARKLFYTTQRDMAGQWQRVRYSEKRAAEIVVDELSSCFGDTVAVIVAVAFVVGVRILVEVLAACG
ncbi:uncharacterized protein LOC119381986 [Rhipicephalus sanguineus]|uniref:uncharacterized protein LOC119381986 n=1 Tax=Rhipicephalus sanguineus TaxID=34632 RepID=UPI0020C30588|nr:uncharacterized protein LOC119381986 [Rhipicephalus sanguineus]